VRRQGFTFLEIMIVVSILAIIFAMGLPFFLHHRAERELEGAQRTLQTQFGLAREASLTMGPAAGSASANNGTPVIACVMTFPQTGPGFIMQTVDNNGNVLQTFQAPASVSIAIPPGPFRWDCNGALDPTSNLGAGPTKGKFTLSSTNTKTQLTITLSPAGGASIP